MTGTMRVSWYEHDCDWLTKYCDEHHQRSATVPADAFMDLVDNGDEWAGITVRGLPDTQPSLGGIPDLTEAEADAYWDALHPEQARSNSEATHE